MSISHSAISGNYDGTFNAVDLPKTDAGYIFEITHLGEVLRFEEFTDNVVDLIYRGADVTVEAVYKEWNAALQTVLWPFSSTIGKIDCPGGDFAVDASSPAAVPLILTAQSCTPAGQASGAAGPNVITFHKAVMDLDVAARINLDNNPRMVPIRFRVFLADTGTDDFRYFTFS